MQMCDIFRAFGEARFPELLKGVSMGRLRTYQIYERMRLRCRLNKLNTETLRKSGFRLWERILDNDEELASDLSQSILISQLDMIIEILDFLGVPHRDGFFNKDVDLKQHLTGEWQAKAYENFRPRYSAAVLLFYLNHLGAETGTATEVYLPTEPA
jgi:hypothetical protein